MLENFVFYMAGDRDLDFTWQFDEKVAANFRCLSFESFVVENFVLHAGDRDLDFTWGEREREYIVFMYLRSILRDNIVQRFQKLIYLFVHVYLYVWTLYLFQRLRRNLHEAVC